MSAPDLTREETAAANPLRRAIDMLKPVASLLFFVLTFAGLVILGYWADYRYKKAIVRDALREAQEEHHAGK